MSKLKVKKGIKGISSISSVLVLTAVGVLSTVSPAQAADYRATLKCVNPSLANTCEVDIDVFDEGGNFQDDASLNCDAFDQTDTVLMTDLDSDTTHFHLFTDARNIFTGTQNDCDIFVDADEGSDARLSKHLDQCFQSASKVRSCKFTLIEQ